MRSHRAAVVLGVCLAAVLLAVVAVPGGAAGQESTDDRIQTDYFTISYTDGNRGDAEAVASFADDYYEVLFQRFGVEPVDEKIPVRVVEKADLDCESADARGCYKSGVEATIYVTSDSRSVFYHELTHRFQAKAMEGGAWIDPPGSIDKFDVFVEGTASYLDRSAGEIRQQASFRAEEIEMTTKDATGEEYADLSLFTEFVLHEYGREGFDMLYTESDPRDVASLSESDYPALVETFYDQLPEQESRLAEGGAPLAGFTYDPFLPEPGSEVTFDARTPSAIAALDRSWYDGEAEAYEWDFDGDGEIDATGPTVTRTIDDPASTTVTLYVTVDGERYRAEQDLLDSSMALSESAVNPAFEVTQIERGAGLNLHFDDESVDYEAAPGQTVGLDLTVENNGIAGSQQIEFYLNGEQLDSRQLNLDGSERREISVDHTIPDGLESGSYEYEVRIDDQRWTRQIYILQPEIGVKFDSISVPDGTEGWIENARVKPGKRMEVQFKIINRENANVDGAVELYVGDEMVETKDVSFGSGSNVVSFDTTAPSSTGAYQIRAVPVADSNVAVEGASRRINVREDISVAEIEAQSDAGRCPLTVTSVSIYSVYKGEEGWVDPENVDRITPDDDIRWNINAMPDESCEGTLELTLDFNGETRTFYTGVRGPMEIYFDPAYSFEEPGEHEVRHGNTVLDTVTISAAADTTDGADDPTAGEGTGGAGSDDTEAEASDSTGEGSTESSTPGFGPLTGLTAVVSTAAILYRER